MQPLKQLKADIVILETAINWHICSSQVIHTCIYQDCHSIPLCIIPLQLTTQWEETWKRLSQGSLTFTDLPQLLSISRSLCCAVNNGWRLTPHSCLPSWLKCQRWLAGRCEQNTSSYTSRHFKQWGKASYHHTHCLSLSLSLSPTHTLVMHTHTHTHCLHHRHNFFPQSKLIGSGMSLKSWLVTPPVLTLIIPSASPLCAFVRPL